MKKVFKKIIKYLSYLLAGVLFLILLLYFTSQTPVFKNWLRNYINDRVSQAVDSDFHISHLQGNPFSSLILKDITLQTEGDTLVYIPVIQIEYRVWSILWRNIEISSLTIQAPVIDLHKLSKIPQDSSFIESKTPRETGQSQKFPFQILASDIKVINSKIDLPEIREEMPEKLIKLNIGAAFSYNSEELIVDLNKLNLQTKNPEYSIEQIAFKLRRQGTEYKLQNLILQTAQNNISANLQYSTSGILALELQTGPLNLPEFHSLFPQLNIPPIYPRLNLGLTYKNDSLNFTLSAREANQNIDLELKANNTGELLKGNINENIQYVLQGNISNLAAAKWISDTDFPSQINGDFQIEGTSIEPKNLSASMENNLYNSSYKEYAITNATLIAKYAGDSITNDLSVQGSFGRAELKGKLSDLWNSRAYSQNIRMKNFNAAAIAGNNAYQSDINIEGFVHGQGFTPSTAKGRGQFKISSSSLAGHRIDSLFTNFSYAEQKLNLDTLLVNSEPADLGIAGNYDIAGQTNINFSLNIKDLYPLKYYSPLNSIRGSGSILGHLQGKADSLEVQARLDLKNLKYQKNKLESLQGNVAAQISQNIIKGQANLGLEQVTVNKTIIETINLSGDYTRDSISLELDLQQAKKRAHIVSRIALDSIPEITVPDIAIDYQGQAWRSRGPATRITLKEGQYQLSNFNLIEQSEGSNQKLSAAGLVSLDGAEDFNFQATNIDIGSLNNISSLPVPMAGNLNLDISLQGTAQEPIITGQFGLVNGTLNNYQYRALRGDFNYENDQFNLDVLLQSGQSAGISITGNAFFHYSFPARLENFSKDTPFQLAVKSAQLPLSLVKVGNLPIKEFSGNGSCDIRIKGPLNDPQITGAIEVNNGKIKSPQYGIDYQNMDLNLTFNNNTLQVERLNLKRDSGSFNVSGGLGFKTNLLAMDPGNIDINFKANKFYLTKHRDHQVQISGNGFVKSAVDATEFGGKATILRSSINLAALTGKRASEEYPKMDQPLLVRAQQQDSLPISVDTINQKISETPVQNIKDSPQIYHNLRGNYKIVIPRNTWIKNENMRTELTGEVELLKDGPKLKIFGNINVVRGHYDFLGRRFKLKEGQISFTGSEEINPTLNLTAQYNFRTPERNKKTLKLVVSGKAKQPEIQFYLGDEQLNEGDAVAYIMFGKSIGQLSAGQQEGVTTSLGQSRTEIARNLAANLISAELNRLLSKQLNLDYIEIQSDDQWQSASFIIGKYITNDLFVSYQRGLGITEDANNLAEIAKLEYQLTKIMFLQLIGHAKYSGFDLMFQFQRE